MSSASLELRGLDALLAKLAGVDNLLQEMAVPTREVLLMLKERMRVYPSPPPGSQYVRTHRLKSSWQENLILAGNLKGKVESGLSYAPFVQDDEAQAEIHQGRWQTIQDVAGDSESVAVAIYEEYIQGLISRL